MPGDNKIKKIVDSMHQSKESKKVSKSNRTHSLLEPQYSEFAEHVRSTGHTVSDILDQLIAAFMHEARNDLMPSKKKDDKAG